MKKYLLDTDICVYYLRGEYKLNQKIKDAGIENCYISEITIAELQFGVECSDEKYKVENQKNLEELKDVIQPRIVTINSCFNVYAREKAKLKKEGQMLGEFDMLIGCSSVANNMIMVTRNVNHFKRIEGIQIKNWIDD